jgi:hypothetical protein
MRQRKSHLIPDCPPDLSPLGKRLEIRAGGGARLTGERMSPANGNAEGVPLLLGFGGNAWNAENVALYLCGLFPKAEVVAFHYVTIRYRPPSDRWSDVR